MAIKNVFNKTNGNSIPRLLVLASLLFVFTHTASAATDAGSLLLKEQQQKKNQQLQLPIKQREVVKEAINQLVDSAEGSGKTIVIQGLLFTGKQELLSEAFQAQVMAEIKGKRLGIKGIVGLTNIITANLQQQGRLLARATLPPQDITAGSVNIEITEGYLENIQLNYTEQEYTNILSTLLKDSKFDSSSKMRVKKDRLESIINDRVTKENVNKSKLEEALLRINDHPGVNAMSRLVKGTKPNSSNLIVDIRQQPLFSASMSIDNYGSYSTGKEQIRGEASLTDTTGYGDFTQFALVASQGQLFARGVVSLPIQTSDFTVNAGYSFLDYENIDDIGSALELEGYAHFLSVGADYSFYRSRNLNVNFNANLDSKALVDDSIFGDLQDKQSLSSGVGVAADMRDAFMGGGVTYLSSNWTLGDLDLSGVASALETDQQSLQTDGQFQRFNFSVARIQRLPNTFSLFGRVYGQWASKNLDSSEGFILGGPTGLRSWAVGEANGDMGMLSTIELRYDLPTSVSSGRVQLATFIDSGRIWINQDSTGISSANDCACNIYSLSSVGVSARWDHQYFTLLGSYAQGVGDNPGRTVNTGLNADDTDNNYQFWLSATVKY
jgi:hemolysin activation/secretion protein